MSKYLSSKVTILSFIIIFIFTFIVFNNSIVLVYASEAFNQEEKIYCNATIEDDFEDNVVIVALDKFESGP